MATLKNSPLARTLFALSLLLICSACDKEGLQLAIASKQAVVIPPPPAFLAPVAVPVFQAGDDARADLVKTTAALKLANARLTFSRQSYLAMRKRYGAPATKK